MTGKIRVPANNESRLGNYALLAPFFAAFLFFWAVPLAGGFWMSLFSNTVYAESEFVGLAHYGRLLTDARFGKAIANTLIYTLATLLVVIPMALLLAQCLRQSWNRLRPFLTFCLLLPGLTPPSVLAILFLFVFHGNQGLLNQWLVLPLGFEAISWTKDPRFIMTALVLQAAWRWTGFITFFFLAGMEGIPRPLYEAAHLETNNAWTVWRRLTLPLLRPVVLFAVIYLVVDSVSLFSGAYLLLGRSGSTGDAGLLLVTYNYDLGFGQGKSGTAAAMSLMLAPVLIGLLWLCFLARRGRLQQ